MRETGHAGRAVSDRQVLEFATTNGRAVVTLNRRHFVRLHLEHPTHAGIVVCTYDLSSRLLKNPGDRAVF